ncbi:hypothetical protein BZG36_01177 [Bifiguratus adelaidae]|uniref:Alanine--tRNA ligase n=1 Tax=Bifiguratus adelaidae TaxID=1938954 RepID=A0A261Y5L7_9FUNG|nr:hypothetical protein BZG36_01177 [Bifiguratus adelaidae]
MLRVLKRTGVTPRLLPLVTTRTMRSLSSSQLRKTFRDYFEARGHKRLESANLIPQNDPTLLFVNAGMVPFKKYFENPEPAPYKAVTTLQKVVRAGGKHNDLDNVGFTPRHHTFFEMLGNFSFGGYDRKAAMQFAWDFLTKELEMPQERLKVTILDTDEESYRLWTTVLGLPPEKIERLGPEDNLWTMGDGPGPCGPCSEIFWDTGRLDDAENRWLEVWNLVFMEQLRDEYGNMTKLPTLCVDTGMGLERMASALQGKLSTFDTDQFTTLIGGLRQIRSKAGFKVDMSAPSNSHERIVADHFRTMCFLIGDGVTPANVGRGYVLRRIIRRALRSGHQLGLREPFLSSMFPYLLESMPDTPYPTLPERQHTITSLIQQEERLFFQTLTKGLDLLEEVFQTEAYQVDKTVPASVAYKLYDTYGFPLDLSEVVIKERGWKVNVAEVEQLQLENKQRSRATWKGAAQRTLVKDMREWQQNGIRPTFIGYDHSLLHQEAEIVGLMSDDDGKMIVALDPCPFYGHGGGQVADKGSISLSDGSELEVLDVFQPYEGGLALSVRVPKEKQVSLEVGQVVRTNVDLTHRLATEAHHTATHLLHAALRNFIGPSVSQAGSLVDSQRLRFDFTHSEPVSSELQRTMERWINDVVTGPQAITRVSTVPYSEAMQRGAMALFSEKYGDMVRTIEIPNVSLELCSGTHVSSLRSIYPFKIISESSVAAGTRRIEAVAGKRAIAWYEDTVQNVSEVLGTVKAQSIPDLVAKVNKFVDKSKVASRHVEALENVVSGGDDGITMIETRYQNIPLLVHVLPTFGMDPQGIEEPLGDAELGKGVDNLENASGGTEKAEEQEEQGQSVQLSASALVLVFLGLWLAVFLAALDQTIVSTALPRVASDFLQAQLIGWVGASYLLTANALQALYGRFSDIFGRKAVFLFCVSPSWAWEILGLRRRNSGNGRVIGRVMGTVLAIEMARTFGLPFTKEEEPEGYRWTADHILDQLPESHSVKGKTYIITGGHSGLGEETTRVLAARGATVVIGTRSPSSAEKTIQGIRSAHPNADVRYIHLDLCDLDSIRQFVKDFHATGLPLHGLVCNAGVMTTPYDTTKQGFELQFGTNHVAHHLLIKLLIDDIVKSGGGRVICVSSNGHVLSPVRFNDLGFNDGKDYDKAQAYGQSKTANILCAKGFNTLYSAKGVECFSLHPGAIKTNLARHLKMEEMQGLGFIDDEGNINPGFKSIPEEEPKVGQDTPVDQAELPKLEKQQTWQDQSVQLSKAKLAMVFVGLVLGIFLSALDQTIVSTALPTIASDFNAASLIGWVGTSYMLTSTVFQPLYGKFSDIFGRKFVFLFAVCTFLVGSILSGASQNMIMLIVFRALQGIGGGGIMSMTMIIISDIVSMRDRGKFQGMIGATFGVSSVVGPLLGGAFADLPTSKGGWRWCFYVNLPVGAITIAVCILYLRLRPVTGDPVAKFKRIDYFGTFLLVGGVVCILLAVSFGGNTYPWDSAAVIASFVVGGVVLIAFIIWEIKYAREPVVAPHLFRQRTPLAIFVAQFFFGMSFFGAIYYLPIYFQIVRGDSATTSGLELLPFLLGLVMFSILSGITVSKTGRYRAFIWAGTAILTVGGALMRLLSADSNRGEQIGYLLVAGVGCGCCMQTLTIAAQTSVHYKDIAIITSLGNFFRTVGGVFGIAISASVFNNSLSTNLANVLEQLHINIPITVAQQDFEFVKSIADPVAKYAVQTAYVDALDLVYTLVIPFGGMAFIASLFIQHFNLQKTIGAGPAPVAATATNAADPDEKPEVSPSDLERGVAGETAESVEAPTVVSDNGYDGHVKEEEVSNKTNTTQL